MTGKNLVDKWIFDRMASDPSSYSEECLYDEVIWLVGNGIEVK